MVSTWNVFKAWVVAHTKTERGANLVEYILLIALIALIVIGAIEFLQPKISNKFNQAGNELN